MLLEPLQQWICDTCKQIIENVDEGWLEWYDDVNTFEVGGYRIVHYDPKCQYDVDKLDYRNKSVADVPLKDAFGSDGLVMLLSHYEHMKVADPKEITDIIRRLHVPYYEEARMYWGRATEDNFFEGFNEFKAYRQDTLETIIRTYSDIQDATQSTQ